jgi:probable rRNA maturation factor
MILNRQQAVRIARKPLELFLRRVRRELGISKADLTVCFVSDAEMARMNQAFRKKKGPTDVLSFPALAPRALRRLRKPDSERGSRVRPYLGDVAISPATARRNAKQLGRSLQSELRVLILHGVLHLLGYDHETDHGEMDRREHGLRRKLGLT